MPSTGEKVTGALVWTVVPRAVQMAVSVFTSILIVRGLGTFDYGTLSVLRTILALCTLVAGFGLGQALNRFIPELRITGRHDVGRALLYRSLALQAGLWLLLSGALLVFRDSLVTRFPTYADLLILGVLLSLAEVAAGTSQYATASYKAREVALAVAIGSLVLASSTALLLHLGLRIPGVLWGAALGSAVTVLILAGLLARSRSGSAVAADGAAADSAGGLARAGFPWNRLFAYALPWIPNNLLNFVVWRQSETLILGIYRTRVEAAYFDIAYKLPQLALEFLPASVYPLLLAGFSETATVARDRMPGFLSFYYRLLFFVVAPVSLLGLAMGDVLLERMYGAEMAPAGPYCQAFFVIFTVSFLGTPLSMAVYVVEKVWINLLLNVGYVILNVGLDLLLIPRYGLLGATLPTAFVISLTPFVRYAIARRYLGPITIPWSFIGRVYLASSPLLLLFWAKNWADSLPKLAIVLLTAVGVVLVSYRVCRVLGPEERAFLQRSHVPGRDWLLRLL